MGIALPRAMRGNRGKSAASRLQVDEAVSITVSGTLTESPRRVPQAGPPATGRARMRSATSCRTLS